MKKYLVGVRLGLGNVEGYIVEVANDYVPESDDMAKLKRKLVKKYHPRSTWLRANPSSCGGSVSTVESNNEISAEGLNIISISRLNV